MSEITQHQQVHPTVAKLEELKPHLTQLGHDPARFKRIVLNEVQRNQRLLECTPASLFAAVLLSAQLDLEPGPPLGLSWFIPRRLKGKQQVTWMLGYRGMVELARRAGIVVTVGTVHEADQFVEHGGTSPRIEHRPALRGRGDAIAWYAVGKMEDGRTVHRVLTKDDVDARRGIGDPNGESDAWNKHYDAMARKTAIRALFSQLPMSPQARDALAYDDQVLHLPAAGGDVSVLSVARDHDDADTGDHVLDGASATAQQIIDLDQLARNADVSDEDLSKWIAEKFDGASTPEDLTAAQADDLADELRKVAP